MKKCKKKAKTPGWLGVLVGGRAKLSTGWMGVGGWVVGLGGRMREIGRGNGSREAKWVEAWVQG